jgi:hypothetical protein
LNNKLITSLQKIIEELNLKITCVKEVSNPEIYALDVFYFDVSNNIKL